MTSKLLMIDDKCSLYLFIDDKCSLYLFKLLLKQLSKRQSLCSFQLVLISLEVINKLTARKALNRVPL